MFYDEDFFKIVISYKYYVDQVWTTRAYFLDSTPHKVSHEYFTMKTGP